MEHLSIAGKKELLAHKRERATFLGRVKVLWLLYFVLVVVLVLRVAYLQFALHDRFQTAAEDNRIQLQPIAPVRGEIIDINGSLLAANRTVRSVFYDSKELQNNPDILIYLATLLGIDDPELAQLQTRLSKLSPHKSSPPLLIKSDINDKQEAMLMVRSHRLPGLQMNNSLERFYPYGESFSHVIGYMGLITKEMYNTEQFSDGRYINTPFAGRIGQERNYENILHGYPGWKKVEVDVRGNVKRTVDIKPAIPGKRIRLGLNAQLQIFARNLLGDHRGSVVAISPETGRLLVLLSTPGYDPNLFIGGINSQTYNYLLQRKDKPFFARYSHGLYAPASTIKPFYALTLLNHDQFNPDKKIYDRGYYQIQGDKRLYRNWKRKGHGKVGLDRAIRVSNDTYFFTQADQFGYQTFEKSLRHFGFGRKVALDVPGEKKGVVPTPAWKKKHIRNTWFTGDTLNMSIGQGYILSTPLQLATATAILANRGKAVLPRLLVDVDDKEVFKWENIIPLNNIEADAKSWDRVVDSMISVTSHPEGTASRVGKNLPYKLAGKTGTAQLFTLQKDEEYEARGLQRDLLDNALFIGFAPADAPRIAIAVVIENGGSGSRTAAPIAARVIDAYLRQNFAAL